MGISDVSDRDAVVKAILEMDRLGREEFLSVYGFGPARTYFISYNGGRYDSKAIVGAAHGFQHGQPLTSGQFSGGEESVVPLLRRLGFDVVKSDPRSSSTPPLSPSQAPFPDSSVTTTASPALLGPQWSFQPGDIATRHEVQLSAGGSNQGGIAPSTTTPNLMLFSDPKRAHANGYLYDGWDAQEPGVYRYSGHGPTGDQQMKDRNLSILNHRQAGRTIRLFEALTEQSRPGGVRHRYVGAFTLDEKDPWSIKPGIGADGVSRKVIVFRLLTQETPATTDAPSPGQPDSETEDGPRNPDPTPARLAEGAELVSSENNVTTFFERPPVMGATAQRIESQLVTRWETHLAEQGHRTGRIRIRVPGEVSRLITDTFDITDSVLYEAKSSVDRTTIRLAIGQLLDYLRSAPHAHGALLLPSKPSPDLANLIHSVGFSYVYEDHPGWVHCPPENPARLEPTESS